MDSMLVFTAGDAIAASAVTFAIRQFIRPIYVFRLKVYGLSEKLLYGLIFLATILVVCGNAMFSFSENPGELHILISGAQIFGASIFILVYSFSAYVAVRPAKLTVSNAKRFVLAMANLLSNQNAEEHALLISDLRNSIANIVKIAGEYELLYEKSAFVHFSKRRLIEAGSFSDALLRLLADENFCRLVVERDPWQTAALFEKIELAGVRCEAAKLFVEEIAAQFIISSNSGLAREIDFHGFGSAPIVKNAVFGNSYVLINYPPLAATKLMIHSNLEDGFIERLSVAAWEAWSTLMEAGIISHSYTAHQIGRLYEHVLHRISALERDNNRKHDSYRFQRSIIDLYRITVRTTLNYRHDFDANRLHNSIKNNDGLVPDAANVCASIIFCVFESACWSFKGFDDPAWSRVIDIFMEVFPNERSTKNPDINLIQKILIREITLKVRWNMKGFYPPVTKVLLCLVGPPPSGELQDSSAIGVLRQTIYFELRNMKNLHREKPGAAERYMCDGVSYFANRDTVRHVFRDGEYTETPLSEIDVVPTAYNHLA